MCQDVYPLPECQCQCAFRLPALSRAQRHSPHMPLPLVLLCICSLMSVQAAQAACKCTRVIACRAIMVFKTESIGFFSVFLKLMNASQLHPHLCPRADFTLELKQWHTGHPNHWKGACSSCLNLACADVAGVQFWPACHGAACTDFECVMGVWRAILCMLTDRLAWQAAMHAKYKAQVALQKPACHVEALCRGVAYLLETGGRLGLQAVLLAWKHH